MWKLQFLDLFIVGSVIVNLQYAILKIFEIAIFLWSYKFSWKTAISIIVQFLVYCNSSFFFYKIWVSLAYTWWNCNFNHSLMVEIAILEWDKPIIESLLIVKKQHQFLINRRLVQILNLYCQNWNFIVAINYRNYNFYMVIAPRVV